MSASNALQRAIYERLTSAGLTVIDPPDDSAAYPYLSFSPTYGITADAGCIDAQQMTIQLDVWSNAQDGQREAKNLVDDCRRLLHRYQPADAEFAFSSLRVAMTRVMRDPKEIWHGVLQVEVIVEEP